METTATIKGQIVIPASVRKKFGIKGGTRLSVDVDEPSGKIILTPITGEFVKSLYGRHRGKGLLKELMAGKKRERDR
ncbi:MAG: AbrB/MazE/SpoVT family DNA-binding domain-containing protein [Deltaproteobacteria bacterium]|nr:AbrB/MazE/SpoVT family DNA-binding domain-containing protein [Deltaproteobacteria bacterium]